MKIRVEKAINPRGEHNGYIVRVKGASYYANDITAAHKTIKCILCNWEYFGIVSPDFMEEDICEQLAKEDL